MFMHVTIEDRVHHLIENERLIKEEDISSLLHLEATLMEQTRLRIIALLIILHESTQPCEVVVENKAQPSLVCEHTLESV